ncbi:TonB-dependent receptor [Thalassotalea sp. G2M2-11]|uniref:TonB-dependent receptor n=1 Tax=Thalassotalea sp. G2M2-11 TaxID=2787627 RepID=UPI0019D0F467|nr:TonB-dependent receptor [Thalassotalea sp. G2M2-11]
MNTLHHKLGLISAAVLSAIVSSTVQANETEQPIVENKSKLERIEVTARRTVENLQEVPVSLVSLGATEMAEKGITVITDIQQYVPNTTLQVSRGSNSTLTAYIRGIGQQDPLWGYEPGVGIYIDDIYMARPQGAVLDIFDVERVEVLRGPQGTLYGKNTIGGAVKYVTKEMSGDAEFAASATVGNYGRKDIKLSGQLPIIEDKLYIGAAIANLTRDGFGKFRNNDEDNYHKDVFASRLKIAFRPTEDLSFKFSYDNTQDDSNAKGGYRMSPSRLTGQQPYDNVYDSDISVPVEGMVELSGMSLIIDWDLSDALSFKSVTAKREGDTLASIDFDNTALKSFDVPGIFDDEQFTQEFQLSYRVNGLSAVGGVYYYDGDACGTFDVQLEVLGQILGAPGLTSENGGCTNTESLSAYGQTSFDLDDHWSMTLGARYTSDEKSADGYKYTFYQTAFPGDVDKGLAMAINPDNTFANDESWTHFSPRVGVEYKPNDNLMYYASYTNGFKSGGFNMRADIGADPSADQPYDPEIVDTIELGFKSEPTVDLRVNAAIFSSDYSDMQVTVQRAVSEGQFVARVLNAGEAKIKGLEFESIYAATDNLNINLSIGYIDAEFVEFLDASPTGEVINKADQYVVSNTPDWSINLGANYSFVADIGDFVVNTSLAYRGDSHMYETPSAIDQKAYTLVNAGVTFYHSDGHWTAALKVNNVLDKEYRVAGYNFAPTLSLEEVLVGYYGDPQTVAFTLGYQF